MYLPDSIFPPTQSNCYFHCFVKRLAKFSGQHFLFTKRFTQVSILIAVQKVFLPKCSGGRKGVFARSLQADNKKSAQTPFCYLTISLVILSSNDVRLLKITFSSTLGNDFTSSTELKTTEFGTASKSFYYCNAKLHFCQIEMTTKDIFLSVLLKEALTHGDSGVDAKTAKRE